MQKAVLGIAQRLRIRAPIGRRRVLVLMIRGHGGQGRATAMIQVMREALRVETGYRYHQARQKHCEHHDRNNDSGGAAHLKILGNVLKLIERRRSSRRCPHHGVLEAMIDVIVHECFLRRADGFLDRMQLLSHVQTRPFRLHHVHDGSQMPLGPLKPFDDFRV